jgi:hypothetical protein
MLIKRGLSINTFLSGQGWGNIDMKSLGYMVRVARVSCIHHSALMVSKRGKIKEMSINEEGLEVWKVEAPPLFH